MRIQTKRVGVASRVFAVTALLGVLMAAGCATATTYTVGGTVARLQGTVVLQINGGGNLPVTANGPFAFTAGLKSGATYTVTVFTPPSDQVCNVTNGTGTVANAKVTTVGVTCVYTTTALVTTEATNNGCVAPCNPGNNRVLIYNAPLITGQSANVVLGQPNFTTFAIGTTAATMNNPTGTAEDRSGNLYVADDLNCRIIQFQPPFTNGMSASLVLGQINLSSANCATGITAMTLGNSNSGGDQVIAVNFDGSGNLWVSDTGSNRVLEYKPPFTAGMAATLAIGQADLSSGDPNRSTVSGTPPTSSSLSNPDWFIFDFSGNLWIPDAVNNRVLEFQPPFTMGMAASLVLGQKDFTQSSANEGAAAGAKSLSNPVSAIFDVSGNLWVSDDGNNRVLEYQPPFTTHMAATLVLGQPDFAHVASNQGGTAPTAATLNAPLQLGFDSNGNLMVADFLNNRTLVYSPPFTTGMNASVVLGQAGFMTSTPATTPTGQDSPAGVSVAPPL